MNIRPLPALGLVLGMVVPVASAGPLDPPAGPITSTYKTLTEVEPRIAINAVNTPGGGAVKHVISASGSYYLTGNIVVTTNGQVGIAVQAPNVTIDLNGFSMIGNGIGDDAIRIDDGFTFLPGIVVRNGTIRNWVKEGVDAFYTKNCRIENVTVNDCSNGWGLIAGNGSVFTNCTVSGCPIGIVATRGSTLRDCTAIGNTLGIQIGEGGTASGCSATGSTAGPGFQVFNGSTLTNCTAYDNRGATGFGFEVATGVNLVSCTAHTNDQDGFRVQANSNNVSITNCNANSNRGSGIHVSAGSGHRVEGNTSSRNSGNGIVVGAGCLIRNNTSENNGTVVGASTAAIIVSGSFNRIDGNNVMGSTFGITVANGLVNNTAIRNTATLCTTPYNFPTGVSYGAIVNLPSGSFTDSNSFANLRF